jgi:hypothetical protein
VRVAFTSNLLEDPLKHETLVYNSDNLCKPWHTYLGHFHYGALRLLKSMVMGLCDFKVERTRMCKGCTLGKHAKVTFPRSKHILRGILDLVHSNVCGPISLTSPTY